VDFALRGTRIPNCKSPLAMRDRDLLCSHKKSSCIKSDINPVVKSAEHKTRNVTREEYKVQMVLLVVTRCRARFNHLRFNNHRRTTSSKRGTVTVPRCPRCPVSVHRWVVLVAIVGISFCPEEQTASAETNFSFAPAGLTQRAGQ